MSEVISGRQPLGTGHRGSRQMASVPALLCGAQKEHPGFTEGSAETAQPQLLQEDRVPGLLLVTHVEKRTQPGKDRRTARLCQCQARHTHICFTATPLLSSQPCGAVPSWLASPKCILQNTHPAKRRQRGAGNIIKDAVKSQVR